MMALKSGEGKKKANKGKDWRVLPPVGQERKNRSNRGRLAESNRDYEQQFGYTMSDLLCNTQVKCPPGRYRFKSTKRKI